MENKKKIDIKRIGNFLMNNAVVIMIVLFAVHRPRFERRILYAFGGVTAGICYSKYTLKQLPRGTHDRHTDILVTERFINRNR